MSQSEDFPVDDRYINLFTDFGFKKLFGEEASKPLLISLLNCFLDEQVQYLKNEQLGRHIDERSAIYDLYCTSPTGERFIVEVQRAHQQHFIDRSLYYASFAVQEQAERGRHWNYQLNKVYTIAMMDFVFDSEQLAKYEHQVKLVELSTKKIFSDKLNLVV